MNRTLDVAVIGGGVIGTACAYYCQKAGLQTGLFERSDIASGASGACQGEVPVQMFVPPLIEPAGLSQQLHAGLSEELGMDTEFRRYGSLIVTDDPDSVPLLGRMADLMAGCGVAVKQVRAPEMLDIEPGLAPTVIAGNYLGTDGAVNPIRLCAAFASALLALGGRLNLFEPVRELRLADGRISSVVTGRATYPIGACVLAAGAWSGLLLRSAGLSLPVYPLQGQLLVTECMPGVVRTCVSEAGYLSSVFGVDSGSAPDFTEGFSVAMSITPTVHGNTIIGSSRQARRFDLSTDLETLKQVARRSIAFFPSLKEVQCIRGYAGLRPVAEHDRPIIGPYPSIDNLIIATGHSGEGVTLSPLTGRTVANILSGGERPGWLEDFLPDRSALDNIRRDSRSGY